MSTPLVTINKVSNGYVLGLGYGRSDEIFLTTDELFNKLLLLFEGRCDSFSGDLYGNVSISREIEPAEELKTNVQP
jgi:hypothetical protein